MSSNNVTIHHGEEINNSTGVSNKKLLMWAFLGSDVMFFGTFIGTFMAYRNKSLNGPYPADTIFLKKNRKKYNVILGMYHDQVLTPIKTLFEYDAINITLGLPFTRISPDHGPNEKMLGKNTSNPLSLIKAISFLDKN